MNVMVVGGGGREHALAYFFKKSPLVDRLFWTPGNAATIDIAENPQIKIEDFDDLLKFAKQNKVELTVVGPEAPLVSGISNYFSKHGMKIFGPDSEGARIEGSKIFAKELMKRTGIPTANFNSFHDKNSALQYMMKIEPPYVVKADGLAAGKGVIVVQDLNEAEKALRDMFDLKLFGKSGTSVVIESFLKGEEATVLALCDGKTILPLLSSQDHKPVFDGDIGPNTGGMGAISPAPVVNGKVMGKVMDRIFLPLVEELIRLGIIYRGVIYAGLMIKEDEPFVVEFNCRFGDPEAEAVLPLMESDLLELILRAVHGELNGFEIKWKKGFTCDVVLVSKGYPGNYEKGKVISGLEEDFPEEEVNLFHAGTKLIDGKVVTSGGRVINVVGFGSSLIEAVETAYRYVPKINFDGIFYRKDIGCHGLKYFR